MILTTDMQNIHLPITVWSHDTVDIFILILSPYMVYYCILIGVFGEAGSRTSLMNILMQLRKCCNHPYLFDGEDVIIALL